MNCRINYLYERFPNNPQFASHLEKIELDIWNTLKNEGFPRFQYEGVNYFTLSPKMSKEYKQQMKVLQSLRDKFGSTELFLMKKIAPFDYSLIQVGMGKIEEVQRKIFEENKISNKGQNNVIVRETFNEDAFDKFQKMKSVENNQKQSLFLTTEQTNQIEELENKLINGFLKDFNIDVKEYENFKQEIGFDAYSASDLVSKAIAYQKGESILPEVAYFAYSILGKNNNKIKSQLKYLINKWDKYGERFEYHKKIVNENYGFIKDKKEWKQKITDLVILDFLKENIENQYLNPQEFKKVLDSRWTSEDFTIWRKFINWLESILSSFGVEQKNKQKTLEEIGISIAYEVLNQNYVYFNYPLKKEQIQKYYKETIETDKYAEELVKFGQSIKLVLTGSLALRKAGSVFRTEDELIHDIDWVVPFELNNENPESIKKLMAVDMTSFSPDDFHSTMQDFAGVGEFSWYKKFKEKYPEYRIINAFYGKEHNQKESLTVTGVIDGEYYDENGEHEEIVEYFSKNKEDGSPIKNKTTVIKKHKKGEWIKDTGYVVDFFIRLVPKQEEHENYFKLWKEIMIAKLKMGREKDLTDWKVFVPFTKSLNSYNFNYEGFRHINFQLKNSNTNSNSENNNFEDNVSCFI